jgi:hypothetical protein
MAPVVVAAFPKSNARSSKSIKAFAYCESLQSVVVCIQLDPILGKEWISRRAKELLMTSFTSTTLTTNETPRKDSAWPAFQILAALFLLLTFSFYAGCTVTLIGDYDDVVDKGITDLQETAENYFARLKSTPSTPYDQNFHDGIRARLAVLKSRAEALPKYTLITEQIANLTVQFTQFQQLDQMSARPVPIGLVSAAESGIVTSIESILKLEIALKRTGAAPSGASTKGQ